MGLMYSWVPHSRGFRHRVEVICILKRKLISVIAILGAATALAACGSSGSPAASGDEPEIRDAGGQSGLLEDRLIANPTGSYTMDDLVAIGYKKSKQFETDTLPNALDVWYGFFNKKDIEVRVYDSHQDALEFGIEPAEGSIEKEAGQTDYLIPVVNRYPAYAVFGNLVLLCERELGTCEALIDKLQ
jgi:hypothetical protein